MSSRLQHGEGAGSSVLPPLRFPEFRNSAPWSLRPIGEAVVESRAPAKHNDPQRRITVRLHGQGVEQREYRGTESTEATHHFTRRAGQFIYGKQNIHKGAMGIVPPSLDGFQTSQDLPAFDFLAGVSPRWFLYSVGQEQFYTALEHRMTGTGSKRLSEDVFRAIELPIPEFDEQQKIADCLTSLDDCLAAQGRKVQALKAHKKGLMQHLFPQEGQTLPHYRFPEFRDGAEWEARRIDQCGDVQAGKALAVGDPGELRPYLRTKNVLDGQIDLADVLMMPMTDAEFSRFEVLEGDILLNEGQALGLVGRSAMYRGEFGGRCAMQNQLLRFRAFPSTCAEFAAQAFRVYQKNGTFAGIATKTTSVAHLGKSRLCELMVTWPSLLPEQQRVAACLSTLDACIAAEAARLDALRQHKKGLMQGLFPAAASPLAV